MLVAFALTNHACFRDRTELSLEAVGPARRDDQFSFATGHRRFARLNRATAIYGPNGSGKSSLIQGLAFARKFVLDNAGNGQTGAPIPQNPFLFDEASRAEPTTFEIAFIQEGTAYEFGFAVDRERVQEEWLFAWPPGGRMRRLLERRFESEADGETWYIGSSVRGSKETWRQGTRPNALFTSTAALLNSDVFRPVVDWFGSLQVIAGDLSPAFTIQMATRDRAIVRRILQLLYEADIAVSDLVFETRPVSIKKGRHGIPSARMDPLSITGGHEVTARFAHPVAGTDRKEWLDLDQESEGTQRLFAFAGPWLDVLDRQQTVVIDELDRSLHPYLVSSLVRRINSFSPDNAEKRSQVVMAVHDATLIQDELDRSQIWFTEKDRKEAAGLTPLSDFRPRPNESLMRGYLRGRYGGVPVVVETEIRP